MSRTGRASCCQPRISSRAKTKRTEGFCAGQPTILSIAPRSSRRASVGNIIVKDPAAASRMELREQSLQFGRNRYNGSLMAPLANV